MPLLELRFKVSHDCPIGNISRRFQTLKMYEWCNRKHEVLELVLRNRNDFPAVMNELRKAAKIVDSFSDGDRAHIVTKMCTCGQPGSVSRYIDKFNLLQLDPVVYEQGWEYYRTVAFGNDQVSALMKSLKNEGFQVEMLRKTPFKGSITGALSLTADALFSGMTEKQMDALMTAYVQGYFSFPRRTDVQTMAARMNVPRTTFVEHLKKAENKMVVGLVPYIEIFRRSAAASGDSLPPAA